MLAVRAIYHQGSLEWLESPPPNAWGMVAVVFLETEQTQSEQAHTRPRFWRPLPPSASGGARYGVCSGWGIPIHAGVAR